MLMTFGHLLHGIQEPEFTPPARNFQGPVPPRIPGQGQGYGLSGSGVQLPWFGNRQGIVIT